MASDFAEYNPSPSDEGAEFEGLEYEAIAAAVAETPRGRWFLDEFARRVRAAEIARVEAALGRIESRLPSAPTCESNADNQALVVGIQQRLLDLTDALRASGASDEVCTRIEMQAQALIDLSRRRNLMEAAEMLEIGISDLRRSPAA